VNFGYYPGCALHGSSNDYGQSVRACLKALGVGLQELDDWICCGATAAHSLNHNLAVALPARNLALAERDGLPDLLAPCPMCSMELMKAQNALAGSDDLRRKMADIVELPLRGQTRVLNLIQVLQLVGLETIKSKTVRPLTELRPACYYGCLLTRPPETLRFDDCEHPSSMETILRELGAQPVEWNYKTECCGSGLTMADEDVVLELSHKILSNAKQHGANCMVVACPMCHVNLDMKQADVESRYGCRHDLAVYYLSDLVGLAAGLGERELGIDRHFVVKQ
jgi:heterodisulfide reductase subunit B2